MANAKLHVLHCGSIGLDRQLMFSGERVLTTATKDAEIRHEWHRCPSWSFILEHPDGRVLIDTSIDDNYRQTWDPAGYSTLAEYETTPEERLEGRLKQFGLGPEDFQYVLLTHLHSDHAGNVRLFGGSGVKVVLGQAELEGARSLPGDLYFIVKSDFEDRGLTFETFDRDTELMRDVHLVQLPGHTWGSIGLLVRLEHTGWVCLTGDACYAEHALGPPPIPTVITMDTVNWAQSLEKLRTIRRERDALLIFGHDAEQVRKLKLAPGAYYE